MNTHDQTQLTALEKLKTLAEEAFQPTFATGCMMDPHHKILDITSVELAFRNFQGKPTMEFLRALRHTRHMLTQLQHFLKFLIGDAGPDCFNDKLAAWSNYETDFSASTSPSEILNRDLNLGYGQPASPYTHAYARSSSTL